jgi:hypothetical protein
MLNERGTTIHGIEPPEEQRPTHESTGGIQGDEERKAAHRIHGTAHKEPLPGDLHPFLIETHLATSTHHLAQNLPLHLSPQIFLSKATELEQLPWKKIYHTGSFDYSRAEESDIVFRRNAEVIVPGSLDLNALHYVYCRSNAERETLLHLLSPYLRSRYQDKIVATTRSTLFYRQQTFIEMVRLSSEAAYVHFSPESKSPGLFRLRIELETPSFQGHQEIERFSLQDGYRWKFPLVMAISYTIRLFLDDHLAYANRYEETEIPF